MMKILLTAEVNEELAKELDDIQKSPMKAGDGSKRSSAKKR